MIPQRVRLLRGADLPIIRGWMRDAPEAPAWGDETLTQIVVESAKADNGRRVRRAWLVEDDRGVAAGFAIAAAVRIPDAPAECELEFIFVAPAVRRAGTGQLLLRAALLWARELRAREIWLEVRASNTRAIAFYAQAGFVALGGRPGYYVDPPEDAVLMRRRIDDAHEDAPV